MTEEMGDAGAAASLDAIGRLPDRPESAKLAEIVREARRVLGISQAELARRAGITAGYVSRIESMAWESGGPWPSDDVLRALARVLRCSSTGLVDLIRAARARAGRDSGGRGWGSRGMSNCTVCVGHDDVQRAAQELVERNPNRGFIRLATRLHPPSQHERGAAEVEYWETLARRLTEDPTAVLYRMCVVSPDSLGVLQSSVRQLAGGREALSVQNIRTRICFSPPDMLEAIVGEREALIAVPDRRGHPFLRASLVIDDPDFVGALRDWFDDAVWEPIGGYTDIRYDTGLDQDGDHTRTRPVHDAD